MTIPRLFASGKAGTHSAQRIAAVPGALHPRQPRQRIQQQVLHLVRCRHLYVTKSKSAVCPQPPTWHTISGNGYKSAVASAATSSSSNAAASAHRGRSVVVTGASSGIGKATALLLAQQGWCVFAGVRTEGAAAEVDALHPSVTPLMIDVTHEASIAAAASQVAAAVGGSGLTALVNNAGRAMTAPVEFLPLDVLRQQLEVNLIGGCPGMVAVTQQFLQLLRQGQPSRIVNVGSQSGTVALPMFAPYACSKFGVEALSDCLRLELAGQGIQVCLVNPGAVRTPIWSKSTADADMLLAAAPPEAESLYGRLIRQVQAGAAHAESVGVSAEEVAEVIATTLEAPDPKPRIVVGRAAALQMAVRRLVPDQLWDALLMSSLEKRGRIAEAAPPDAPLL